jgi:hypothetical protein
MMLDKRMQEMLRRGQVSADPALNAEMAVLCLVYKGRPATAAGLFEAAFGGDPRLADKLGHHRYNAVCAVALAGCGQGADADGLDHAARARWRGQALAWLRAELGGWQRELSKNPAALSTARGALEHWRRDADLAGVRNEARVAALPDKERTDWRRLWTDVEALLARTRPAGPPPKAKP